MLIDPYNTTYYGDVFTVLPRLIEQGVKVNMCVTSVPFLWQREYLPADHPLKHAEIGQEDDPLEYVVKLVKIFSLVRELLPPDGSLWVDIGDKRNGSGGSGGDYGPGGRREGQPKYKARRWKKYKPQQLLGMPERFMLALQDEGWCLVSKIPWWKINAVPDSANGRPSDAWEPIYLFGKTAHPFYDRLAVKQPQTGNAHSRGKGITPKSEEEKAYNKAKHSFHSATSRWHVSPDGHRRLCNVWPMNVQPYSGAHTATFPEELPLRCILLGTSRKGHCPKCGRGWIRIVEKGGPLEEQKKLCGADAAGGYHGKSQKDYAAAGAQDASDMKRRILEGMREEITVGWRPPCSCGLDPVPGIVLDPFMGSGTTARVAERLGRCWIGIDINEANEPLVAERTSEKLANPLGLAL